MNISAGYTLSSVDTLKRVGPSFRVPGMVFWVASDLRGVPSAYQFVDSAASVNDPVAVVLPNEGGGHWRKLDRHVLDELDDVSLSTLAAGQALYYDGQRWVNRKNEVGFRQTLVLECPEIQLLGSFARSITLSRTFALLRCQISRGLWVRFYRNQAQLAADVRTGPGGPLPEPGNGPCAEFYAVDNLDLLVNPIPVIAAEDSGAVEIRIVRLSGVPGTEAISLGILPLEQTLAF